MCAMAKRWIAAVVFAAVGVTARAQVQCPELGEAQKAKLAEYVVRKYKLAAGMQLDVSEVSAVEGTCFRKLRFSARNPEHPFLMDLVASPDFRFLTRELLDSRVDPLAQGEEKRLDAATLEALTRGDFPSVGPKSAPVTLTLFFDFECPFCAQMASGLMKDILPAQGDRVRVLFRNFPLEMHPWARPAAEAAACAAQQGNRYFWNLHDFLFDHQKEIKPDSLTTKVDEQAAKWSGFDVAKFDTCVAKRDTAAQIDRDLAFGREAGVSGTPTLFINGQRIVGFKPEQIRTLIRQMSDAQPQAAAAPVQAQKD
jgi:protein-disulfide isomerase